MITNQDKQFIMDPIRDSPDSYRGLGLLGFHLTEI